MYISIFILIYLVIGIVIDEFVWDPKDGLRGKIINIFFWPLIFIAGWYISILKYPL